LNGIRIRVRSEVRLLTSRQTRDPVDNRADFFSETISPLQCQSCQTDRPSGKPHRQRKRPERALPDNWRSTSTFWAADGVLGAEWIHCDSILARMKPIGFHTKPEIANDADVHAAATALNYFAYNFIKIHRPLRTSPAMAAGVTDRLWSVEDLVALWEAYEQRRAERQVA